MFKYALKLRYPNGRTFDYHRESEQRLRVGSEFDVFGRTWRIAADVPPSRFTSGAPPKPDAFLCYPVSASAPAQTAPE